MKKLWLVGWLICGLVPAAASYPERSVHVVVGFTPGGGTDLLTRLVASKLSEKWHQAVVVENRVGAEGTIALNYVAHAVPDGYTLVCVVNTYVLPRDFPLAYDPIKSFAPVSELGTYPAIFVVNESVPVDSLQGLIALAKAKPGVLNYGSLGDREISDLMMHLFLRQTGIAMVPVRYQGGAAALVALMGNEIQLYVAPPSSALTNIRQGQFKALGVTTDVRSKLMPEIPTIAEAANLPGYNAGTWNAILAPAGTPPDVVHKINADIAAVMQQPEVQKTMAGWAVSPATDTPEELAELIRNEAALWAPLVAQAKPK